MPGYPMSGRDPLAECVEGVVLNFARAGATIDSIIDDGLWAETLEWAPPGDVAHIRFGRFCSRGGLAASLACSITQLRWFPSVMLIVPIVNTGFHDGTRCSTIEHRDGMDAFTARQSSRST